MENVGLAGYILLLEGKHALPVSGVLTAERLQLCQSLLITCLSTSTALPSILPPSRTAHI